MLLLGMGRVCDTVSGYGQGVLHGYYESVAMQACWLLFCSLHRHVHVHVHISLFSLLGTHVPVPVPAYPFNHPARTLAPLTVPVPLSGPGVGPLTVQRNGTAVTVTARGSTATVVAADVAAGAGVVHVVDAVLLPFYTTLLQVGVRCRGVVAWGWRPGTRPETYMSVCTHAARVGHCAFGPHYVAAPRTAACGSLCGWRPPCSPAMPTPWRLTCTRFNRQPAPVQMRLDFRNAVIVQLCGYLVNQ